LECGRTAYGFVDHSLRREVWPIILCMKEAQRSVNADDKIQQESSSEALRKRNESKTTAKKDAKRSFTKLKDLDSKARLMFLIRIVLNYNQSYMKSYTN
jgi:hypothetical protein